VRRALLVDSRELRSGKSAAPSSLPLSDFWIYGLYLIIIYSRVVHNV